MKTSRVAYLKNFFSGRNSIIRATTAFFISLLLIIWPELLSSTLIIIFGALIIAYATFDIAKTIYSYCKDGVKPTAQPEEQPEEQTATAKIPTAVEKPLASRIWDILKRIKVNTNLFLLVGILLIALKHFDLTAAMIILATGLILSAMLQLWAIVSWMSLTA